MQGEAGSFWRWNFIFLRNEREHQMTRILLYSTEPILAEGLASVLRQAAGIELLATCITQQLIDLFYCAVGGSSPMPRINRRRDRQVLCGATPEPHVQRNMLPLHNGHVVDEQTSHAFPFPVGQSR